MKRSVIIGIIVLLIFITTSFVSASHTWWHFWGDKDDSGLKGELRTVKKGWMIETKSDIYVSAKEKLPGKIIASTKDPSSIRKITVSNIRGKYADPPELENADCATTDGNKRMSAPLIRFYDKEGKAIDKEYKLKDFKNIELPAKARELRVYFKDAYYKDNEDGCTFDLEIEKPIPKKKIEKLIAYYPFDGNADDMSGNNYNGVIDDDVPFVEGKFGQAAEFGAGWINIPYNEELDINPMEGITISVWVNLYDNPSKQHPIFGLYSSKGNGGTKNYLFNLREGKKVLGIETNNQIVFDQHPLKEGYIITDELEIGRWYHIVVVQDKISRAIYLDNIKVVSDNNPESYQGPKVDKIRIGKGAYNFEDRYLNGLIDELSIYNYVLGSDKIGLLYEGIKPIEPTSKLADVEPIITETTPTETIPEGTVTPETTPTETTPEGTVTPETTPTEPTPTEPTPLDPTQESGPIDIPAPEEEVEVKYVCNGCTLEDKCYTYGYRKNNNYCSEETNEFVSQLDEDSSCSNNFQCKSNLCVSNKCVSESLLQKIIDFFKSLFGVE